MTSFGFFFSVLVFLSFFFDMMYVFSLFFFSMFLYFLFGVSYLGCLDSFKVGYPFSVDMLGFYLVLLIFWVFSMVFLIGHYSGVVYFLMFLLFFFLYMSFVSFSLFWFYIFFECSMIPIFFMIMGWGSGESRLFSAYYMFIYTVVGSIPCLFILVFYMGIFDFMSFDFLKYGGVDIDGFYYFLYLLVFVIKAPLFIFHIWLPKAHVDAPVYGSMILASVMLKLGGFGVIRGFDVWGYNNLCLDWVLGGCLVGLVYLPLVSLFSVDMKVIVAYSSVVHMCLMLGGLLGGSDLGSVGGFLMLLSHGICSSGLFMMVNMIYLRSGSRLLFLNKGILGILPLFVYFWLFMIMDNIGAPPSISLFSEVFCLGGIFLDCGYGVFFVFLGLFLMSCVMMNIFSYSFGGWFYGVVFPLFLSDYLLIFFHLFPLNCFFMFISYLF